MATCLESSSFAYCPNSSSVKSPGTSTETFPVEDSPLAGLMDPPTESFLGIRQVQNLVASHSDELQVGRTNNQYIVFLNVTNAQLTSISKQQGKIGKHIRMTHHTATGDLIIKLMPSVDHEAAHLDLAELFQGLVAQMGISHANRLAAVGGTTYFGPGSSKQADTAYKPRFRPRAGWPTIVFESGLSKGIARLRVDARWWLINSSGEVKIALIISVKPAEGSLLIEKWCLSPATNLPVTRANPTPNALVPTKMQEIHVTRNPANTTQPGTAATYTVTGGPLVLEFQSLFLRTPVAPEGDVIFNTALLSEWANLFWDL